MHTNTLTNTNTFHHRPGNWWDEWKEDFKWECVTSYYRSLRRVIWFQFFLLTRHRTHRTMCTSFPWKNCWFRNQFSRFFTGCTFSVHLDYNLLDNWACIHILCKLKFDTPKYAHTKHLLGSWWTLRMNAAYLTGVKEAKWK